MPASSSLSRKSWREAISTQCRTATPETASGRLLGDVHAASCGSARAALAVACAETMQAREERHLWCQLGVLSDDLDLHVAMTLLAEALTEAQKTVDLKQLGNGVLALEKFRRGVGIK